MSALIRLPGATGSDRTGSSPSANESSMSETARPVVRSFAHLSDEAVVALLARSDESALAELYDRFGRVAYGLALRNPPRRQARGGRRAGRFPRRVAQRRPLHAGAREGQHLVADARAPPRGRSRAPRGPAACGAARARPSSRSASGSAEDDAWLRFERERVQSALKQLPDQQRGSTRAGLLRRLQPDGARRETRTTRRYDQEQDVHGPCAAP